MNQTLAVWLLIALALVSSGIVLSEWRRLRPAKI